MDIIASMLGYLVGMTGLVAGLIVSAVIFFSPPNQEAAAPTGAIAMLATPRSSTPITEVPAKDPAVETAARTQQKETSTPPAVTDGAEIVAAVTPAVEQKPASSQSRTRRLAEKERARHLAMREHSSFEARFLHYDD
jgi:hypothetical protein